MENINLLELYKAGIVKDGGHNINVQIEKPNGKKYSGKTYAIPLKYLYYNEQNGRIGVALSNYESINGHLTSGHNEEYNMVIQKILEDDGESNTKNQMNDLKRNIAIQGQDEPGYVLNDGRVIDGNRRFTAKRLIEQDSEIIDQQYFEAVILDDLSVQNHDDLKKIKSLELKIQFGKLGKVDYNAIDRAVDAYKTIVINNVMTAKEYAGYANLTPNEVHKRITEAEIIVKFLEFTNANPDNYALAKDLDLDGPIQNIIPQYKKFKDNANSEQLLNSLFAKILQIRATKENYKDDFRTIVQNVVNSKNENTFISEMEDATDSIIDVLDTKEKTTSVIGLFDTLKNNIETADALADVKKVFANHSEKTKNLKERTEPINLVNKAINNIDSIDINIFKYLSKPEKEKLFSNLKILQEEITHILLVGE
ncbi:MULTISPECIES: RNA polymerase subunit sigma-70 [Carnobacterium]|uniref:RNA polymerase subunit sigma-70 n=1 Tax=Carnobacterium inhibens TaxID=147709 RepID=A0ABR7TC66_9LACT|nr:RNA polymerase subunit sigma-70 [Carnobacterium inhibens]MBC9825345.1 RNA polymerase subunit sigma-70 [Carnobacterium inhibens]